MSTQMRRARAKRTFGVMLVSAGKLFALAVALLLPAATAHADMPSERTLLFHSYRGPLVATLIIELAVAAVYLARLKLMRGLGWVLVANLISLPFVWFVIPSVMVAEIFAVGFEAAFLYLTNRRRGLSLGHAFMLSLLMNTASYFIGPLLLLFLPF